MKIIDITGPIFNGMWNYPEPLGALLGNFKLYPASILILASCINLEFIDRFKVKLRVIPFRISNSFISPVRAVITF